jgi:uncharacterized protein (PEP-CTERM system associated)
MAITGMTAGVDPVPGRARTPGPVASSYIAPAASAALLALAASAHAQYVLHLEPTIGLEETLTSNANFDRDPSHGKRADLVTQITPGFRLNESSAYTSLAGFVNVPILLYARTGADNNRVLPDVSLIGNANAFDKHLQLDGSVDAHRQFLSPFGARPTSLANNTANEYTATTFTLTPSLRGDLPQQVHYELRDQNSYTHISNAPTALKNTYFNDFGAALLRDPLPFGGGVQYEYQTARFSTDTSIRSEIARVHGDYAIDPQLRVSLMGGYENQDYTLTKFKNTIYGAGVKWRPTERTLVDANWEHRFFGTGYHVEFEHRTPLTVWTFHALRDVTTYPQQIATLAAGQDVSLLLNRLFSSRITDPLARQAAVDQVIHNYALPSQLSSSIDLLSQQVTLITEARAQVGLLGARNNVYVALYRQRNEVITGQTLFPDLPNVSEITQSGANVVWASRLGPIMTLTGILDYLHSVGNNLAFSSGRTDNGSASLTLTTPLSAVTDFHAGVRYQFTHSNLAISTDEAAVYVGIFHRFR